MHIGNPKLVVHGLHHRDMSLELDNDNNKVYCHYIFTVIVASLVIVVTVIIAVVMITTVIIKGGNYLSMLCDIIYIS